MSEPPETLQYATPVKRPLSRLVWISLAINAVGLLATLYMMLYAAGVF